MEVGEMRPTLSDLDIQFDHCHLSGLLYTPMLFNFEKRSFSPLHHFCLLYSAISPDKQIMIIFYPSV